MKTLIFTLTKLAERFSLLRLPGKKFQQAVFISKKYFQIVTLSY